MTDTTDLIARLREYGLVAGKPYTAQDCACHDAADALEAQAREIADCNRLRDDERLTWDAQHKRQASMNAHLAELVTDAQEEMRKCQQDAIALQDRLAEAEALLREAPLGQHDRGWWNRIDAFLAADSGDGRNE